MFNKISEYAAPYVKEASELIMKIAAPLLETQFGKAAVSAYNTAQYYAVEAAYKVVDATEWVLDKGAQMVNYAGQKATDLTNWIAETNIVKKTAGLVKDMGSWVASTAVFKKAIEMTTYIFTKMSNYCTAIVESYHYYNQCRTMSRQIAMEVKNLADEQTILRSYHDVALKEAKIKKNNVLTDNVSFFDSNGARSFLNLSFYLKKD